MKKRTVFLFIILSVLFTINVPAQQNKTMTVEANIFKEETPVDQVSIEVPDYVFLGNVSKGESTDKYKVYVNNTGTVNITISLRLEPTADEIFNNLFFQNRQSGNNSEIFRIGSYSFGIEKPSAGSKRSEYFWMWLDLTDYSGSIPQDMLGERAGVTFVALPQNT